MRPASVASALAVLLACAIPAAAQAAPTITEFSAGLAVGARLDPVALGADGNVWFGDQGTGSPGDAVGYVTPSGAITEYTAGVSANSAIAGFTAGPGGMWFTESAKDRIGQATLGGSVTQFSWPNPVGVPAGIADGPDGNVWFTESQGTGAIGRITPGGVVTEFVAGLTASASPGDIIAGPDGNLWFTETAGRIGRITPQGTITEFSSGITGAPLQITTGPDGNLWFTEQGVPSVARITTQGVVTEFSAGLPSGSAPRAITSGADGNLYFTDNGANAIGTVTPDGAISEFSAGITPGADLRGIVTGSDGAVWFAEYTMGALGRMTVAPGSGPTDDSDVTDTSATLSASVSPNSAGASYYFEWGTSTAYGQSGPPTDAGAGSSARTVTAPITGLQASTVYHARVVASNATGTTYGPDAIFTTTTAAPASATAPPTPQETPPQTLSETPQAVPPVPAAPIPELGSSVVGSVTSGTVRFRAPGKKAFATLGAGQLVPTGAVIDTRKGKVSLVSALDAKGRTQQATFWSGVFTVRQARSGHGMVDVYLRGTPTGCRSHRRSARSAARRTPRIQLWGKDSHGRYRTHGQSAVATVRGTEWLTAETCAGTLTRVVKGSVSVWDRRTHKRVIVTPAARAGRLTPR